jgi:trigger factor
MAPGERRTITVTFPADYHSAELAGKEATFEITAKTLKVPVVPAVDDALAEKIGFDNLEDLRGAMGRQVQREYDQLSRLRLKRELLDALAKIVTFDVPVGLVEAEFAQIWQRVEADRKDGRADEDDAGKDDETLRAEYRAIAERRVRLGLLLAEIGRTNNIVVGADEMNRAMRVEAGRYPGQEQMVMDFFRKNPQAAETLRGPIFEDKVVDFVLELSKVSDLTVSPEELSAEPSGRGETSGHAESAPAAAPEAADTAEAAGQTSGESA